jgi:hypothetical protein
MTKTRLGASLLAAGAALTLAVVGVAYAQTGVGALPDTQKLIMENALVRVYDIRVPPGTFEPTHSHGRGLTIALTDYDNETRIVPDGQPVRGHTRFGEVRWAEPVVHEARNVGTTEQHVIRIELK